MAANANQGLVNSGGVMPSDGALSGWVINSVSPGRNVVINFYLDSSAASHGSLIGSAKANITNYQANYRFPQAKGNHGFYFRIPPRLHDGRNHTVYVQPVNADGTISDPIYNGVVSFSLPPRQSVASPPAAAPECIAANSRCPSVSDDYLEPNYGSAKGWSDGTNYFKKWGCKSTAGFNNIARLNIIPLGTMGPNIYKDSGADWEGEGDAIYFDLANLGAVGQWSMKKAVYNSSLNKWEIFSVLDNPKIKGGISSHAGIGPSFVMNDYALPGFGPSTPVPGPQNKIPGVSKVSANSEIPSYPLVGSGPLGITAMTHTVYPVSPGKPAGPQGQTCLHVNPKLLDYDAQGVPHTLLVNIYKLPKTDPFPLPPGAPVAQLPAGNYLYRFKGATLGWQLDLNAGMITDSLSDPNHRADLTPRYLVGTKHGLVSTNWYDGAVVDFIDLDKPVSNNAKRVLDCSASGIHIGDVSGSADRLYFAAANPNLKLERQKYHLSDKVPVPVDLFYAFKQPVLQR